MSRVAAVRALKRFASARSGSALVEFALVAIPFFLLTFGLAEVSMIGFAQTTLDHAIAETARGIRTGQVQTEDIGYSDLKQSLCDEINGIMGSMDCANLYLDVDEFESFSDAQNNNPVENGQFSGAGFGFAPGAPNSIVVVRAYYRWEIITPLFESLFANVSTGERILSSTMMFRNEPFPEPT
jgi:Flp pilus assembly protein TadG